MDSDFLSGHRPVTWRLVHLTCGHERLIDDDSAEDQEARAHCRSRCFICERPSLIIGCALEPVSD